MTKEELREKLIEGIADLLRCSSFSFEYRVKKKPEGIKIISEVTQEQLNAIMAKVSRGVRPTAPTAGHRHDGL